MGHLCQKTKLPKHAGGDNVHERDICLQHDGCHEHVSHVSVSRYQRAGCFPAHDSVVSEFTSIVSLTSYKLAWY